MYQAKELGLHPRAMLNVCVCVDVCTQVCVVAFTLGRITGGLWISSPLW